MVATLAQAASAAYYLENQRSFRHPNEYYTAGEEPDGVWFNPKGLFGLADGGRVDSADFHRLYNGFAPDTGGKLTQNAGGERRSAGLDMTFSADKSVSALWAVADPELRSEIERAHNDAARVALEETVLRHCAYTRIRNRDGEIEVLPADISAAMFQHGTSRDNDPQLHTHCVIFNAARTHRDGRYRALHQHPAYSWMKAAGAVYRNALAWSLRERLGIPMEQYGRDGEFTRIAGMPGDLTGHWSKRRAAIIDAAREMGFTVQGNAPRAAAANKITRAGKSPDNDPEIRHARWRGEAEGYVERELLIASLLGTAEETTQEQVRALTEVLEDLPNRLTREEAVFRLPDIVERVGNATAGLLNRDAVATSIERVLLSPEVVRLTRPPRSAEGRADMAHTRLYSTRHNLEMEMKVREMAEGMTDDTGQSLPARAVEAKVTGLLEAGYPLSAEQINAIRYVTSGHQAKRLTDPSSGHKAERLTSGHKAERLTSGHKAERLTSGHKAERLTSGHKAERLTASSAGRVAIIEGAAGSGKTTTLRPIADLYREHGRSIIATAVAWRTAVALGNDVDARPFCVDKLLRLAARGGIDIDANTTIIVDEAGMLSTRQAHHILRLSERFCAKIVFAGDTQQQQPVGAGPGLRLIRDAVGSVRVDRIRRQKADLEDILVHVHMDRSVKDISFGDLEETREKARLLAGSMEERDRARIVAEYEAVEDKPVFTPWQVAASEALRDGDAASAIAAHHLRGRFHMGYDEENTLTRLVDDWDRYRRANPGKSAVVLARTRAEVRALSHLMRQRRFAALPDGERANRDRVTVMVSRGTEDDRATSPLEIMRGDCLRIGATHWEKQLFNGTVVTVDDFRVEKVEAGAEPSVLITARTEDGRSVSFRHDEIRDWYGNIRLDHGYALTITSAQGLTVDRTFLLADARPSRETIYPAATRHREALDIYVNRAPLALDIADRRADDDREVAVTDTEIREYLAERWSRSQPKEAALDYMVDGVWEDIREDESRSLGESPGESRGLGRSVAPLSDLGAGDNPAAANDNALARIARDVRRTAFGWRHAQAVASFADGRRQVLAAYDSLRERTRIEGDAVALGEAYRETLTRHAVLLKQAEAFRARPDDFASLLAEHGGIGRRDLDAFEDLHRRARRHRRAATMRHVFRIKKEAEQQGLEPGGRQGTREGVPPLETVAVPAGRDPGVQSPPVLSAPSVEEPSTPTKEDIAWDAYSALRQEWSGHLAAADRAGVHAIYVNGCKQLRARMEALAENPALEDRPRRSLGNVLAQLGEATETRREIEDYLAQVKDRLEHRKHVLETVAMDLNKPVTGLTGYGRWRAEIDRLAEAGRRIMDDRDTYSSHLNGIPLGLEHMRWALTDMGRLITRDDRQVSEAAGHHRQGEEPATPETDEERQRRAEAEAREFARLQSAAYNAPSDEEARAANKALDDYVERHSKKRETVGEDERRTRKRSQGRSMGM